MGNITDDKTFKYVIEGEPVAKGRPRFSTAGGYKRAYTPKKTRQNEQMIKQSLMTQRPQKFEGALEVDVTFYKPPLKSWSKKKVSQALAGEIYPTKKPDIDNYLKTILDACDGILWHDDAQITELKASKRYAEKPRTEIEIREIGEKQI